MLNFQDLSEITNEQIDLLEAVGYTRADELYEVSASSLLAEMKKANALLGVCEELPKEKVVRKWVEAARAEHGISEELQADVVQSEVDELQASYEDKSDIVQLVMDAPMAEAIPAGVLKQQGASLDDIPEGIVLVEHDHDHHISDEVQELIDKRRAERAAKEKKALAKKEQAKKKQSKKIKKKHKVKLDDPVVEEPTTEQEEAKPVVLNKEVIQNFDDVRENRRRVEPLQAAEAGTSVQTSAKVNEGVDRGSRRYVRGVLHPAAGQFYFASLVIIGLQLSFLGSLCMIPVYFFDREALWPLWIIGSLILFAILWLFSAPKARCQVCRQRQYTPKKCFRHKKAHHVSGIGYMLPTALHALLFHWFRCIFCGTSLRLKK